MSCPGPAWWYQLFAVIGAVLPVALAGYAFLKWLFAPRDRKTHVDQINRNIFGRW